MPSAALQPHPHHRTLSPELRAAEDTVRRLTFTDFAFEIRLGHHLGYVRSFASPRVADILARSGQVEAEPHRRATDTALFTWELIYHGLDSPQGRTITDRITAMHQGHPIRQDDARWVLTNFVVPGLHAIDRHGWRPLAPDERQALIDWWGEVGIRLGADPMPADADGWAQLAHRYEQTTLAPTADGRRLLAATTAVAVDPVPRPLRPLVIRSAGALFDAPTARALGLPEVGWLTRIALRGVLRARALTRRLRGPGPHWFTPGAAHQDYPHGYTLDDLGPHDAGATPTD